MFMLKQVGRNNFLWLEPHLAAHKCVSASCVYCIRTVGLD